MKRYDFAGSITHPRESTLDERVRDEEVVLWATTSHAEFAVTDSDELTETEWSAFMGLGMP